MSIELSSGRSPLHTISKVLVLGAFLVLVSLGTWQLHRLSWKEELIDKMEGNLELPSVQLPVDLKTLTEFDFRHVYARGVFDHEQELYLVPRMSGGKMGVHVLTPYALDGGLHVLVNRGWVPSSLVHPDGRTNGLVEGRLYLEGVVRIPKPATRFTPDNEPSNNAWYWIDLPEMSKAINIPLLPIVIEAGNQPNPGGWPVGGQTRLTVPNHHFGYALTWYALAFALVVIVVVYRLRRNRSVND